VPTDHGSRVAWRLLDIALTALLGINITVTGWTAKSTYDLSAEVASLRTGGLTAKDGLELWQEIFRIREQVALQNTGLTREWFEARFDSMGAITHNLDVRLTRLESKGGRE